jgi:hypothetical protein
MGEMRGAAKVCWGNLTVRDYLKDLHVDGRTILKWIFKKQEKDRP